MRPKTTAELQLDALRQMKEDARKAPPRTRPRIEDKKPSSGLFIGSGIPSKEPAFEIEEAKPKQQKVKGKVHAIPISPEMAQLLKRREKTYKEFSNRIEMGDWAAELLLALPINSHRLGKSARADLFSRMSAWAKARGLQ